MEYGQIVFITCRLLIGAVTAFCAIVLWSKTRDAAWMLVVMGTLVTYSETVYSIFDLVGISGYIFLFSGSVPVASILLFVLRSGFFIAAFLVMVFRRYRYRYR